MTARATTSNLVGFTLFALGCLGVLLRSGGPSGPPTARSAPADASGLFILKRDLPSLGLRRGEHLAVLPDAPIRLGDVVALKSEPGRLVLARFHDELMHCVEGLVHPLA